MEFRRGVRFAVVSSLPPAASRPGVVLEQGGRLWYSDGTKWVLVSLDITVGTTAPSSPALNQLWVDTN